MLKDLANIADEKVYDIALKELEIKDNIYIYGTKNIVGRLIFYYDELDDLCIDYELKGTMICPDSMTLEKLDVDFDIADNQKVVTKPNEDGFYLIDGMNIEEFVRYLIIPEVPIKVEKKAETMYYSGDGWTILSEEEYNKNSSGRIDPRLEKLLEYKEED